MAKCRIPVWNKKLLPRWQQLPRLQCILIWPSTALNSHGVFKAQERRRHVPSTFSGFLTNLQGKEDFTRSLFPPAWDINFNICYNTPNYCPSWLLSLGRPTLIIFALTEALQATNKESAWSVLVWASRIRSNHGKNAFTSWDAQEIVI